MPTSEATPVPPRSQFYWATLVTWWNMNRYIQAFIQYIMYTRGLQVSYGNKVSPNIIPSGWLGSKHRQTNQMVTKIRICYKVQGLSWVFILIFMDGYSFRFGPLKCPWTYEDIATKLEDINRKKRKAIKSLPFPVMKAGESSGGVS